MRSALPVFPTTIAGSLPKPAWLAAPGQLWAPWKLDGEPLADAQRDAVRLAVQDQERAGIDIVTDGEQTRRHFVVPCTNCGMVPLPPLVARAKLQALAAGADLARRELGGTAGATAGTAPASGPGI